MEKIIIAQLSVKENKIEQFLEVAQDMVGKSKNENGCLVYRLLNEINKPNEFVIYEKYINDKAVDFHNSSEHFKNFIKSVPDFLLTEPQIDVY